MTDLEEIYKRYFDIRSRAYLYIEPTLKYDDPSALTSEHAKLIKLIPAVLKGEFKIGGSQFIDLIEKKEIILLDKDRLKEFSHEERKAYIRRADFIAARF